MRLLIIGIVLVISGSLYAQNKYAYIDSISIGGNKKTKDAIILRELMFAEGDSVPVSELSQVLRESEQLIMNTALFNKVTISFKNWIGSSSQVHIHIEVVEFWYIYPLPIFELADRNFNVWWVEQNRSMQRLNYGVEFAHLNFTGYRDRLKFKLKFGYTNQFSLSYSLPFINKKQTLGLAGEVSFKRNREVNYITINNKQEFYRDEEKFIYWRFLSGLGLAYRPGLQTFHYLNLSYHQNYVDDIIGKELNPNFFGNSRTLQRYFNLSYRFQYDTRDVRSYPLQGNNTILTIQKAGLGIFHDRHSLFFTIRHDQHIQVGPRWSLGAIVKTKLSLLRNQQPYNDNRAIGFGEDNLSGYEYYIVDGLDMGYIKTDIKFKVLSKEVYFGKIIPLKSFRIMPTKIFFSLHNDIGYVNDPFEKEVNFLNNHILWGGGVALDIILFYDKVISIQYSTNHLLEYGVFLHLNMNI